MWAMNCLPLVLLMLVVYHHSVTSQLSYERVYPPLDLKNTSTNHIYLGLFVSFGELFNSSGNVAGIRVALDLINRDEFLLQNYTLHYVLSDSQVSMYFCYTALNVKY